jgi:nitrate/TMAO reductase-like tetraheme cytochrome c subunit
MNIQDLIDDCNKQIEWINNKDKYNVNALQFASYFKERLIEINDRTCENCKHTTFDFDSDYSICEKGIGWYWNSRVECNRDFGCDKWESKDD